MSRQQDIHVFGIEVVEAREKHWLDLGYKLDYKQGLLVNIKERLEALRREIHEEAISYEEIVELQGLVQYIDKDDVELLQWAGAEEATC